MPVKDKEPEKVYYSVGEISRMFSVAPSLIRFWESEFDILKPRKNKKGNRLFTREDLENFRLIYHLVKEKGFTLQGAKDQLKSGNPEKNDKLEVIEKMKELRSFLLDLKQNISAE